MSALHTHRYDMCVSGMRKRVREQKRDLLPENRLKNGIGSFGFTLNSASYKQPAHCIYMMNTLKHIKYYKAKKLKLENCSDLTIEEKPLALC